MPSERKVDGDRVIYACRAVGLPPKIHSIVLCDFGEVRPGDQEEPCYDDIQPSKYRAPEVLVELPITYATDIWNAGVMVSILNDRTTSVLT